MFAARDFVWNQEMQNPGCHTEQTGDVNEWRDRSDASLCWREGSLFCCAGIAASGTSRPVKSDLHNTTPAQLDCLVPSACDTSHPTLGDNSSALL